MSGIYRLVGVLATCFLPVTLAAGPCPAGQESPASITVHVGKVKGKLDPWILGSNMIGYQKTAWRDASPDYSGRGAGIWNPDKQCSEPAMTAMAKGVGLSVARWPGGCAVHLFDWKKAVGPLAQRPDQRFGLPEFLRNCADIGAEPLVTIADYQGTAKDAAELVEYLNAPNDGTHRWAALRAQDGHAAPWNVLWFEYGNETEHGDHHGRKMSPEEYARRYVEYRHAMKAVDPRVKLGAVIATGFPKLEPWARPVLKIVGKDLDFAIHHSYLPGYSKNDGRPQAAELFEIALAATEQIQDYYDQMRRLLGEFSGRSDCPIAVTEFNGAFVQERPVPYRHCLGNALVNAEMLRVFMQPQNHVAMANFWQFSNEYWGAVKGYSHRGEPLTKRPQYYPFEFYHRHFGPELVDVTVRCGTYETAGGFGVSAAKGGGTQFKMFPDTIRPSKPWQIGALKGVSQRLEGDTLVVDFGAGNEDLNYFHASKRVAVEPGAGYRLTGWIKTEAVTSGGGACFQVGDARGWTRTQSAISSPDLTGTQDWKMVQADYVTLPDAKEVSIQARRISGTGAIRGRAFFRDVRLQKFVPKLFPAVPYLAVNASRSTDGKKVYLIVVNKNLAASVKATIRCSGFEPRAADCWSLTGPSVDATNERDPECVKVAHGRPVLVNRDLAIEFPPHSLTAVEVAGSRED